MYVQYFSIALYRMTATASTEDEAFDELGAKTAALMKVATDIRKELDKK